MIRSFKEIVKARAERDPNFREVLRSEAAELWLAGEADVGAAVLRQVAKVEHFTDEEMALIAKAEVPAEHAHLDAELKN